jgi:hypothetical protein
MQHEASGGLEDQLKLWKRKESIISRKLIS